MSESDREREREREEKRGAERREGWWVPYYGMYVISITVINVYIFGIIDVVCRLRC